jgi:hypothetical protein
VNSQIPEQTKLALAYLIQTAASEGVAVAGFAFRADPPVIISFGNCKDHGSLKLYEGLCELADKKKATGDVQSEIVQPPV